MLVCILQEQHPNIDHTRISGPLPASFHSLKWSTNCAKSPGHSRCKAGAANWPSKKSPQTFSVVISIDFCTRVPFGPFLDSGNVRRFVYFFSQARMIANHWKPLWALRTCTINLCSRRNLRQTKLYRSKRYQFCLKQAKGQHPMLQTTTNNAKYYTRAQPCLGAVFHSRAMLALGDGQRAISQTQHAT